MTFDPDTVTQEHLNDLQRAAELAWGEDTRHPSFQGHPDPSQGQCFVTSKWLQKRLGGFVGTKKGHYFWVSPDKQYVIDLTGDSTSKPPIDPSIDGQPDESGEPIRLEPHHRRWQLGPSVYARSNNPHYRDFRIIEDTEHPRADAFGKRADAYMRGGIPKQADLLGPTAWPGSTPQKNEDWQNEGPMLHDEPTSMSDPATEYKFVYANGQLHVSPIHDHEQLLSFAGTSNQSSGPIAVGYGQVIDGNVTWFVTSNIALSGVHKQLEEFSDAMGWSFEGMLDSKGNPIDDSFGAKKSMWYKTRPDGHLVIAKTPLPHGRRIDIMGKTAHMISEVGPARAALQEWAQDYGYKIAEYSGNPVQYQPGLTTIKPGELGPGISPNANSESLKQQIAQEGKMYPISIDSSGFIVDGEHRYRALTDLGASEIPAFVGNQSGASGRLENPYSGLMLPVQLPQRTAEYPGGGNILDKMKNMPHLDQHNLGDQDAEPDAELGDIQQANDLKCEECGAKFDRINELIAHDKDVHHPGMDEVEQNHFPWPQDADAPLGFGQFPYPSQAWEGIEGAQ